MRILVALTCLLFSMTSLADRLNVAVTPNNPVVNESFSAIFEIETNSDEEPYISFDPGRARVTGRTEAGRMMSTSLINGKLYAKKSVTYRFDLVAERAGRIRLSDIKVELGDKTLTHKDISVTVLREPKEAPEVFVKAIPSKDTVYVGEGFNVDYYVYFRTNVISIDVKEFPKFRKFVKRFHLPNESVESVEYDGKVYRRIKKYSARLFAEKPGEAKIGQLKLEVRYNKSTRRNAFSNSPFGLSIQRNVRKKTIRNDQQVIQVLALPADNVPQTFTGLVGKYDFKLTVPRSKFLVNEAIEAKLEVIGDGALEGYDAPKLYKHEFLEEFDTKTEVQELNNQMAKKIFDYTFLARDSLLIPPKKQILHFFDPERKEYVGVEIDIPGITVGGTSTAGINNSGNKGISNKAPTIPLDSKVMGKLIGPTFVVKDESFNISEYMTELNIGLAVSIVLVLLSFASFKTSGSNSDQVLKLKKIRSGKFSHHDLFSVLNDLSKGEGVLEKIESSDMDSEAKKYFKSLYEVVERESYKNQKNVINKKIQKKHITALEKELRNV